MTYTSPTLDYAATDSIDVNFGGQADSDLLGYLEPTPAMKEEMRDVCKAYTGKVYPRSEWVDRIRRMDDAKGWSLRRIRHGYKQQEGSCVYNSLSTCHQIRWNEMLGDSECVPLSPNSGYKLNSRGPNSGSYVGSSIKHLDRVGLLPSADYQPNIARQRNGDFEHVFGETGNYRQSLPSGWESTAKKFSALATDWEYCTTVEEWVSALLNGYAASGGRDSHCICHCGLAMDGSRLLSIYRNSWGDSWGSKIETAGGVMGGFGFDSESKIRTMVARDAFVLRAVVRPEFTY